MKRGLLAADADLHVQEPPDLWSKRLPEPYRSATEVRWNADPHVAAGVRFRLGPIEYGPYSPLVQRQSRARLAANRILGASRTTFSPDLWLEGMDAEGLDVAALVPTTSLFLGTYDGVPGDHAAAICRVYNDWAYEFAQAAPDRFKLWAWLPRQAPELAAAEAERCVRDLGAVGVAMTSVALDGHLLCDSYFEPLWQAVERLDVPFGVHVFGAIPGLRDDFSERFQGHPGAELALVAFAGMPQGVSCLAELLTGGVLEAHPGLRPVIMEIGASWLPWLLGRLDESWEKYRPYLEVDLPNTPSSYFRRQCFVTVDPDETALAYLVRLGLAGNLLLSTDFPHHDSSFPEGVSTFLDLPEVDSDVKRRILWDNPASLFEFAAPVPA
ncbi:MAG: amidohydrolase [Chloroflexi bacterium]|nr:amidohydrolase [Chloroflexota bacterium]